MPAPPVYQDLLAARRPSLNAVSLDDFLRRCRVALAQGLNWLEHDPCVYCGRQGANRVMSLEHIVPRSVLRQAKVPPGWGRLERGWENHARACRECNSRRSSTPFIRWLIEENARLGFSASHPFRPGPKQHKRLPY